ncbi:hypothetical protein Lepto7376_1359 [[Leptolyngbya] sp. PCC 7376]|uniref:hypothetical protein n=1 Tax=[Leptolyngbya] sp. PCC 7376 TaxID=111781 RepID=UPI00029EF4E6|nr:hypothetical protein [[Leptolyngbya] sp. PCC 7376]AFY37711.1 hypothetical protein Lepto7376_1359 [[Leptolyngbya] sp. PCC 7376]
MTSERTQQLGKLGEHGFRGLCIKAGITVIDSKEEDVMGWDFLVELPIENIQGQPRDLAPSPIKCLVQVKATDLEKKQRSIEVSSLEKLVKAQMPAFYCFVHFDGQNAPQSAYLVHVGNEITQKTLKRIRELDNKGESARLNKHKISITYDEANIIDLNRDDDLKRAIHKYIPKTLESYLQAKSEYQQKIGFENGCGDLNITLEGEDEIKKLINLSLGISDEVTVKNGKYFHKRFDLVSLQPMFEVSEAKLTLKPTPRAVSIRFRYHEFDEGIQFDALLYATPIKLYAEEIYPRFRIKNDFLEIVSKVEVSRDKKIETKVKIYFEYLEGEVDFNLLKKYFSVANFFDERKDSSTLEIQFEEYEDVISIPFTGITDSFNDHSFLHDTIGKFFFICREFGLQTLKKTVSIDSLFNANQTVCLLYRILNTNPKDLAFSFELLSGKANIEKYDCKVRFFSFKIGQSTLILYLAFVGSIVRLESQKYQLFVDRIIYGSPIICRTDEFSQQLAEQKSEEFIQYLESEDMGLFPFFVSQTLL